MPRTHLLPAVVAFGLLISGYGCKNKPAETSGPEASATASTPARPFLSNADISQLYATADHVDIIFYDLPISVNQDDPSSVKNTVLYISPASPNITTACKPLGRLSWMSKGSILKEADIFIDEGCQYLLFMEGQAPVAANALSQGGIDFFKNIISQVQQRTQ